VAILITIKRQANTEKILYIPALVSLTPSVSDLNPSAIRLIRIAVRTAIVLVREFYWSPASMLLIISSNRTVFLDGLLWILQVQYIDYIIGRASSIERQISLKPSRIMKTLAP